MHSPPYVIKPRPIQPSNYRNRPKFRPLNLPGGVSNARDTCDITKYACVAVSLFFMVFLKTHKILPSSYTRPVPIFRTEGVGFLSIRYLMLYIHNT